MTSTPPLVGVCYTVAVPTPTLARFVRPGYKIQAGDRAWLQHRSPPMPEGFIILEACAADWGTVWIAEFALEHLLPSPESVYRSTGGPQNPRPVRPDALTL